MLFSNFINEINPGCLFCHKDLKLVSLEQDTYKKYHCSKCDEQVLLDHKAKAFAFSCKDIVCGISLELSKMFIAKQNGKRKDTIECSFFYLPFYNKKLLYKKLKTYIAFS